jgi:hypothetical protein
MTILNAGAAAPQSSNNASTNIALVGIIAGSSVAAILGISFAIAYSRRNSKIQVMRSSPHDEVHENPIRAPPPERPRSMTFPQEEHNTMTKMNFPVLINNTAQRNPFAAKGTSMKFFPTTIRPDYPPPPPPDV